MAQDAGYQPLTYHRVDGRWTATKTEDPLLNMHARCLGSLERLLHGDSPETDILCVCLSNIALMFMGNQAFLLVVKLILIGTFFSAIMSFVREVFRHYSRVHEQRQRLGQENLHVFLIPLEQCTKEQDYSLHSAYLLPCRPFRSLALLFLMQFILVILFAAGVHDSAGASIAYGDDCEGQGFVFELMQGACSLLAQTLCCEVHNDEVRFEPVWYSQAATIVLQFFIGAPNVAAKVGGSAYAAHAQELSFEDHKKHFGALPLTGLEWTLRLSMFSFVESAKGIIMLCMPLLLASLRPLEFVANAMAVTFVVELDNVDVQLLLPSVLYDDRRTSWELLWRELLDVGDFISPELAAEARRIGMPVDQDLPTLSEQ